MNVASPELAKHPDRLKWNTKYRRVAATFRTARWVGDLLSLRLPDGPVLELAGGPSGMALALAAAGRDVTVIDVSDTALSQLREEAVRRDLDRRLTLVHADLTSWNNDGSTYSLVMCRYFWSAAVFDRAAMAVSRDGLLSWEAPALTNPSSSHVRPEWCLGPGEPASLLPTDFEVLQQVETSRDGEVSRSLVARRLQGGNP